MEWWAWIIFGLAFLVLELAMPGGFFLVFFGAASLILGGIALFVPDVPAWMQWISFSLLSIVTLILFRQKLINVIGLSNKEPVDSLVKQQAEATEAMAPGASGSVSLRGAPWKAVNVGASAVAAGDKCVVVAVDNLTLKIDASAK